MSDELKKTIVVDDRCNNRTRPFPAFIHSALNKPDRKTESEFIYIYFFSRLETVAWNLTFDSDRQLDSGL